MHGTIYEISLCLKHNCVQFAFPIHQISFLLKPTFWYASAILWIPWLFQKSHLVRQYLSLQQNQVINEEEEEEEEEDKEEEKEEEKMYLIFYLH